MSCREERLASHGLAWWAGERRKERGASLAVRLSPCKAPAEGGTSVRGPARLWQRAPGGCFLLFAFCICMWGEAEARWAGAHTTDKQAPTQGVWEHSLEVAGA